MTRAVLELNDHQLGLYNHNGLMFSSPGYVLVNGKQVEFGQQAAEQSRLNPLGTNNEFWHRLSMAPLTRPVAHFRHYADVAHGHLLHLAQESGFEGEIVIAVPASFSREQLAVLTGVLKHSPFKPVAMMDAAFVSASHQLASGSELIFVDVQLHQLSLTRLHSDGSAMRRDAVSVVPGAGWAGISNILVQTATDAFVSQSRFNPQHSAAWEQQLYNQLPQWLTQFQQGDQELIARVQTDKNNVQARISLSDVLDALEPVFQKVAQHAARFIVNPSVPVLLSGRAALIPGLQQCLQATDHRVSALGAPERGRDEDARRLVETGDDAGLGIILPETLCRERTETREGRERRRCLPARRLAPARHDAYRPLLGDGVPAQVAGERVAPESGRDHPHLEEPLAKPVIDEPIPPRVGGDSDGELAAHGEGFRGSGVQGLRGSVTRNRARASVLSMTIPSADPER